MSTNLTMGDFVKACEALGLDLWIVADDGPEAQHAESRCDMSFPDGRELTAPSWSALLALVRKEVGSE